MSTTPPQKSYTFLAYLPDWSTTDDYQFWTKDFSVFSHVGYCFAMPNPDGSLRWTNVWASEKSSPKNADLTMPPSIDKGKDSASIISGNLYQLFLMKRRFRNMKTGLVIGGADTSLIFSNILSTSQGRSKFVSSCVSFLRDYGFDFIELDWEFPVRDTGRVQDDANLISTMAMLRTEVDLIHSERRRIYDIPDSSSMIGKIELYMAVSAGNWFNDVLSIEKLKNYIDVFHIMGYDYCGKGWCAGSYHHSNLYDERYTGVSCDSGVKLFKNRGVPESQISLSVPYYAHVFGGTEGYGKPFDSDVQILYKDIAAGTTGLYLDNLVFDQTASASYIYNKNTRTFATLDDVKAVEVKANYVIANNLNGIGMWAVHGDVEFDDPLSLTRSINNAMARDGAKLSNVPNWLLYNESRILNIARWSQIDLPTMLDDIAGKVSGNINATASSNKGNKGDGFTTLALVIPMISAILIVGSFIVFFIFRRKRSQPVKYGIVSNKIESQ